MKKRKKKLKLQPWKNSICMSVTMTPSQAVTRRARVLDSPLTSSPRKARRKKISKLCQRISRKAPLFAINVPRRGPAMSSPFADPPPDFYSMSDTTATIIVSQARLG
jgi:hypothetical protein